MPAAKRITKATLLAAGPAPSTTPKLEAAHETHIHLHCGIIGTVESGTRLPATTQRALPNLAHFSGTAFTPRRRVHAGFSGKLKSKHDKPLHLEFGAGLGDPLGGQGPQVAGPVGVGGAIRAL